jgi:hypothetical protein
MKNSFDRPIPTGADISFPIWGKKYVDAFLRVTLRLMLGDGNIPRLAKKTTVHVRFYTTKKDEFTIRKSPQFRLLEKYAGCSFSLMVEAFLAKQQSLSCMNFCQRHALEQGFEAGRLLLPFTGDVVITENLLSDAWDQVMQGYRLIVGGGLRLNRTEVLQYAQKKRSVAWNLTNQEGVLLATKHRHIYSKRQTIGCPRPIYAAELYAEAPGYLTSRCFALAPFALFPRKLGALPQITFDDKFIDILFPQKREILILQNALKHGAIFSLTDESEYNPASLEGAHFSSFRYAEKIHKFLCDGNLGRTHLFYFEKPIWYGNDKNAKAQTATAKLTQVSSSIKRYLTLWIILQSPFASSKKSSDRKIGILKTACRINAGNKLLQQLYVRFPELFMFCLDRSSFYQATNVKSFFQVLVKILFCIAKPFLCELTFLGAIILTPWRAGILIKKFTDPRFTPPPVTLGASLFRKIRNLLWPFAMFSIFQMGASLSRGKVALLRFFGSRCAWTAKIHRGVYFKNPWNVVIRKNVEINTDVLFDTPSQDLVVGANAKIGARCYLATVRAAPASWRIDAVNSRITIPPSSRISEGFIILPDLK